MHTPLRPFLPTGTVLALALAVFALAGGIASAQTAFQGDLLTSAGNWSNGLPSPSNPGTIAVDGSINTNTFSFGGGTVDQFAGTISTNAFNFANGGTWNMNGGRIRARFVLSNGGASVMNLNGGIVELINVSGTQHMGAANGATFNVSGSVVLDGTQASVSVQTAGGTVNIGSDWTGSWTWGTYTGSQWRNHFTNSQITFDGAPIDGATFDSKFAVSPDGKTLSLVPFAIASFTVDSGGGKSSGGDFGLTGTIGQPDASAPSTGGGFTISGGFWAANTNPYSGAFTAWAAANIPLGLDRSFDGDANQDGVPNGLAYIFGEDGAGLLGKGILTAPPTPLPGDVDLVLETSDDVESWFGLLRYTSGIQTGISPDLAIANGEITDNIASGVLRQFYRYRATLID